MVQRELGNRVSPLSHAKIMAYAHQLRDALDISAVEYVRLEVLLEGLAASEIIDFHVVEDSELPKRYAVTYPDKNKIVLQRSIYDALCMGDKHARFTVAHELGHLIMHRDQMSYARAKIPGGHKIYEDSEWQADVFAGHFLVDKRLIHQKMSAHTISETFGVSLPAAETWCRKNM